MNPRYQQAELNVSEKVCPISRCFPNKTQGGGLGLKIPLNQRVPGVLCPLPTGQGGENIIQTASPARVCPRKSV